jgi:hypothetical protein
LEAAPATERPIGDLTLIRGRRRAPFGSDFVMDGGLTRPSFSSSLEIPHEPGQRLEAERAVLDRNRFQRIVTDAALAAHE